MNTFIFEEYPAWYLLFCLLAGGLYAAFLYYRDRSLGDTTARRWWLLPLAALRFVTVATICLLLLSPVIRSRFTEVVKPYVVVLQDRSESMRQAFQLTDSSAYNTNLERLVAALGSDYRVQSYHFGSAVNEGIGAANNQKTTNIADALDVAYNVFANQNLGAVVLATDGVYNQGSNPQYLTTKLGVPIYSIALGDTTPKRDLLIEKVLHNRIAYLGDKFTARVDIAAKNCVGENAVLRVYKGKDSTTPIFTKTIRISKDDAVLSEDVILNAEPAGVLQFSASLAVLNNEANATNNRQTFYVEVVDNRQKILLLGASPHPDLSAIKQALEANKNYELTTDFAATFKGNVKDYNVAVLHGLPAKNTSAETVIAQLKAANVPVWYILSEQTDVAAFNRSQNLLQINGGGTAKPNDVRPKANSDKFTLFTTEPSTLAALEQLPPLKAPFGTYQANGNAQTLLYQRVNNTPTQYPLLVYAGATDYKTAVLAGEGLFRWKMYEYKTTQANTAINEIVTKSVQYLSAKNDRRKFRVTMPKTIFNETENISFDAELYNDSYQLVNTPDVNLTIYDEQRKAYPFLFNKTANAYQLNAKFLPVGNYTYEARTIYNGVEHKANGSFTVVALQLESQQTTANHQLLRTIAEQSGGVVVSADSLMTIVEKIKQKNTIKPIQYNTYKSRSIINLRWIFFLLAALLAVEWFVRKYVGGY